MEIFKAVMVGGSSMVILGNGVRALQNELSRMGIDLERVQGSRDRARRLTIPREADGRTNKEADEGVE